MCDGGPVKVPNPVSLSKHVRTPTTPASLLSFASAFQSASSSCSSSFAHSQGPVKNRRSLSLPVSSAALLLASLRVDHFNAALTPLQSPSSPLLSIHRASLPSTPDLDSMRHSLTGSVELQHHDSNETDNLNLSDDEGDINWDLVARVEKPDLADILISCAAGSPRGTPRRQARGSCEELRELLEELNKETKNG
ncbi:hypothetical protein BC830DRAFT_1094224 [Chytriomyces sp. MP71]|nr:hypothetical protein BC830DRAFT_1094224 [Chytriomyces sp. MP71]